MAAADSKKIQDYPTIAKVSAPFPSMFVKMVPSPSPSPFRSLRRACVCVRPARRTSTWPSLEASATKPRACALCGRRNKQIDIHTVYPIIRFDRLLHNVRFYLYSYLDWERDAGLRVPGHRPRRQDQAHQRRLRAGQVVIQVAPQLTPHPCARALTHTGRRAVPGCRRQLLHADLSNSPLTPTPAPPPPCLARAAPCTCPSMPWRTHPPIHALNQATQRRTCTRRSAQSRTTAPLCSASSRKGPSARKHFPPLRMR